ncbi:hypothetical protein J6590_080819 [Homalodisca vitripennis]|nr:hypothetical protein J6590_080819 [Homalodisca vitripennis]
MCSNYQETFDIKLRKFSSLITKRLDKSRIRLSLARKKEKNITYRKKLKQVQKRRGFKKKKDRCMELESFEACPYERLDGSFRIAAETSLTEMERKLKLLTSFITGDLLIMPGSKNSPRSYTKLEYRANPVAALKPPSNVSFSQTNR